MADKDNNFNVNNPTNENIELAFMHVYYYLYVTRKLSTFKSYYEDIENIIKKLKKIMDIFIKYNDINEISMEKLQDIEYSIQDFNYNTQNLYSYYPEWILVWMDAIITMKKVSNM